MFWATCCLGYFAFLRSGEFTVPSLTSFDPAVHMSAEDIAIDDRSNPTMLFVRLKASKCDQTRQGVTLSVCRTTTQLCPVAAVLAYLVVRRSSPGPLFMFQDGSPLTHYAHAGHPDSRCPHMYSIVVCSCKLSPSHAQTKYKIAHSDQSNSFCMSMCIGNKTLSARLGVGESGVKDRKFITF